MQLQDPDRGGSFRTLRPAVPEKTEPTGKTEASSNMTQMDLF